MSSNQHSQLHTEMEIVKSLRKPSTEERRGELQKGVFQELKEVLEKRRREEEEKEKATERLLKERETTEEDRRRELQKEMFQELREVLEKRRREEEEKEKATERLLKEKERIQEEKRRQEAKQREEEERKANEAKALEPTTGPRLALSESRYEEVELCRLQRVEDEASRKCLSSVLKGQEQRRTHTLFNNGVGEQRADNESDEEDLHPNSYTNPTWSEKAILESKETPKSSGSLLWLKKLSPVYWLEKYRDRMEKKKEARRLKAEARYAKWTACKERQHCLSEQLNCYTEGFPITRNSILKKAFR